MSMGALSRMYPHELTSWRRVPEGRSARWERREPVQCRFDRVRETRAGTAGDAASWHAEVLMPSRSCDPPLALGDRIALGRIEGAEPPADALAVTACDPVSRGTAAPDHWEAEAR